MRDIWYHLETNTNSSGFHTQNPSLYKVFLKFMLCHCLDFIKDRRTNIDLIFLSAPSNLQIQICDLTMISHNIKTTELDNNDQLIKM